MKLTRVAIQDFRCFGDVVFDLVKPGGREPLEVALLVGANGSGKSACLDAIVGVFTEVEEVYGRSFFFGRRFYGGASLRAADVRQGAARGRLAVTWRDLVAGEPLEVQAEVDASEGRAWGFEDDSHADINRWLHEVTRSPAPAGTITFLDVFRLAAAGSVEGPRRKGVIRHRCEMALAPTIGRDGALRARAQELKQWIVNLDALRAKAKADHGQDLPVWHTLRHALNTLLKPYTFEGVDENFDVLFQTRSGRVPLEALSDGFRSTFVIISDLLLRLSLATDRPTEVLQQEAVCLIDEVDAHLHPRWQETIIPGLRAMFPNVQLIATTHSPYVVGSVEPENVFRLDTEEG